MMTSTNDNIDDYTEKFYNIYLDILKFYESDVAPVDRWTLIAKYINEHNQKFVKIFYSIKDLDVRKDINLDYNISFQQLKNQITQEADSVVKASLIILALHYIAYELLSSPGNYYLELNGQDEMHILKKKIIYYISVSAKIEQNIYFHAFIIIYALESLFNSHFYVGVDFEYTRGKKIELAQLNFEHNYALQSIIMLINPDELEPDMLKNFIRLIMCNKYMKKILHGADSLDVPYVYNVLFAGNPNKIRRFTRTLIDTRFLCEYYKLTRDEASDNKCSIYDEDPARSAIYYFSVVSEEQQKKLGEMLESIHNWKDIEWNIHKLPKDQLLYAQYDVIFLKYFYYRMIYVATEDEQTDLGKKSVIELYKHVLNEITQFVYLERNNITSLMMKCKEEVDPVNNYFIKNSKGIFKLIDIYNKLSIDLVTTDPVVTINKLTKVNHFKIPVMTLIKRIIYGYCSQKCRVQKDKNSSWTEKMHNTFIFDFLKKMNFFYLLRMFKDLDRTLEQRVRQFCS